MQTRVRWQTLLSFGILLALLVSAAGYFYWVNRPFTLEQLAPVDKPTLVHSFELPKDGLGFPENGRAMAWNARGDLLAVAHTRESLLAKGIVSIYSIDGKLLQRLEAKIDGFDFIDDLEWHPTKDILAVSYLQALILWSADGTIIKRIDNDLAATFKRLSWNQQTQELAVVDHYRDDKQMYDQIVLFDDHGIRLRRLPMKFDMVREMEWINQGNIIINDFDGVYSFNTSNEKRQRLFEEKQYSIDVDLNHNLVIGNTENNSEELTIWQNGITKTFEIPQFSGRSQAISPRGKYTVLYPPYRIFTIFNNHTKQFNSYSSIQLNLLSDIVEWHPSKPLLAVLTYDEIQLWQLPE